MGRGGLRASPPLEAMMAAITHTQIMARRDALMRADSRVAVIVQNPGATDDGTPGVFLVKDPDPGDAAVTGATSPGNAKGGDVGGYSWKSFSYAALGTAYGLP